jgi:hypothetical protein
VRRATLGWIGEGPYDEIYVSFLRFRTGHPGPIGRSEVFRIGFHELDPVEDRFRVGYVGAPDNFSASLTGQFSTPMPAIDFAPPLRDEETLDTWQRWEMHYEMHGDQTVGVEIRVDEEQRLAVPHWEADAGNVPAALQVGAFWLGGHTADEVGQPLVVYYDDVYVAQSQAHVEIGDAPEFGQCQRRDILLASAWSDHEIAVECRDLGLVSDQYYYVFVVDGEGQVSTGFQVPVSDIPAAPSSPTFFN